MTQHRWRLILYQEAVPTTAAWRKWAAQIWDKVGHLPTPAGVSELEHEAGLRALLRAQARKYHDDPFAGFVEPADIAEEVKRDPKLAICAGSPN